MHEPEALAAIVIAAIVILFAVVILTAVWGALQTRRLKTTHRKTMAAVDEIAAEPGEAEQWPRSSN